MESIHKYGLITDDIFFASILSSYFHPKEKYLPIFSLPRMTRDDWQTQVYKRIVSINRAQLERLFCKYEDYGLLAPLRSNINVDLIPLKEADDISRYINFKFPEEVLRIGRNNVLIGLIIAKKEKKKLKVGDNSNIHLGSKFLADQKSKTLVAIEKSNEITDVTAINYALAKGYDIYFIDPIPKNIEKKLKGIFVKLSTEEKSFNQIYTEISAILGHVFDFKSLERKYKKIQFIVSELLIGILIESIPVAHLLHIQSELRIIDEFYYLEKQKKEEHQYAPSFLFVDIQSKDLISEIPVIGRDLNDYKHWKFNLNGKYANRSNFKIYSRYFPFDALFVSGHGSSPDCREVIWRFKSRDGKTHYAKILEYYQFGRMIGDKIEVEVKEYPLEFDGISWEDKETLAQNGILHLLREYNEARDDRELVEHKNVNPKSIEGLLLSDGLFTGMISVFTRGNNPIVFFNTCGSLVELGGLVSFAGPRALIGTMWSVYDNDAGIFAKAFFENLPHSSVVESFYSARQKVSQKYSKIAYAYFGTLNVFLPMRKNLDNEEEVKKNMARRLVQSLDEAALHFLEGYLIPNDLETLIKLKDLSEKFVSTTIPNDIDLRKKLNKLRGIIDSN